MIKAWSKSVGVWMVMMFVCFRAFSFTSSDELVREANQLLSAYKDYEALQKFEQVLAQEPNHYQALFQVSLLHSRIGARFVDESQKIEHFTLAKIFGEKALAVNRSGADAHYVMALATTNLSYVSGVKSRISYLRDIKSHLDIALAANPKLAGAWQLMGRWHYKVANFNFMESALSKVLNGSTKEDASNASAVACFKKAIALDAKNLAYYYDLAVVYQDMKEREQSISTLQEAITLHPVTSEDLELSRRCKAMLARINPS